MTSPRRYRDSGDQPLLRTLFEADANVAPPDGAEARALLALGLAPIPGGAAAAGAAATKKSITASAVLANAKWIVLAAVGAAVSIGTYAAIGGTPVGEAPRQAAPIKKSVSVERVGSSSRNTPPRTKAALPRDTLPASSVTSNRPSKAASISEELELLDRARSFLAASNVAEAKSALDSYDARFKTGALREEAAVARIELLVAAGDGSRATSLGKAFLAAHPSSTYARRVSSLIEEISNGHSTTHAR